MKEKNHLLYATEFAMEGVSVDMKGLKEEFPYMDILHLPHPVSDKHPRMSLYDRSAQFAPFAALTGHEEAIEETARLTEEKPELDEAQKERMDGLLQMIKENLAERPMVTLTYFIKDEKKSGGAYRTKTGRVEKMDDNSHVIIMEDGTKIEIEDLYEVEYGSSFL